MVVQPVVPLAPVTPPGWPTANALPTRRSCHALPPVPLLKHSSIFRPPLLPQNCAAQYKALPAQAGSDPELAAHDGPLCQMASTVGPQAPRRPKAPCTLATFSSNSRVTRLCSPLQLLQ